MFASIYTSAVTPAQFFLMAGTALVTGFVYAWLMSFRIRSTKRFFIVAALIPFVVAAVITFVNGNFGAGVAIGGAFGLIRFRSAQGSADEIAAILGLFPELSVKIWDLHKEGKYQEAMDLQRMVYTVWMSITGPQFPRRLKAALECIGRGCGDALAPLCRASDEEFTQIRKALEPYIAYAKENLRHL